MERERFDRIARLLAEVGTRRGVLRLGAALPVAGALAALLDEESEAGRRRRHKERRRDRRRNRNEDKGNGLGAEPTCLPASADRQEAINDAPPKATITLCAGTWNLKDTIKIDRNLALIGAGVGKIILDGGGIFSTGGLLSLRDGSLVSGNSARQGGGIYNDQNTLFAAAGSSVTANTASVDGGGIATTGGLVTLLANDIVTSNTLTDGTTVSNCAPKNAILGCFG